MVVLFLDLDLLPVDLVLRMVFATGLAPWWWFFLPAVLAHFLHVSLDQGADLHRVNVAALTVANLQTTTTTTRYHRNKPQIKKIYTGRYNRTNTQKLFSIIFHMMQTSS